MRLCIIAAAREKVHCAGPTGKACACILASGVIDLVAVHAGVYMHIRTLNVKDICEVVRPMIVQEKKTKEEKKRLIVNILFFASSANSDWRYRVNNFKSRSDFI
jgi:hypothetical protein